MVEYYYLTDDLRLKLITMDEFESMQAILMLYNRYNNSYSNRIGNIEDTIQLNLDVIEEQQYIGNNIVIKYEESVNNHLHINHITTYKVEN